MTKHSPITDNPRCKPTLTAIVAKGAGGFGVCILHGGEAIAFLTPAQAETDAAMLRDLAKIARNPGKSFCEMADE